MSYVAKKLVITGGPCGGKTSSMPFLSKKLTALGYLPFIVPEAPTILINAGITPTGGVVPLSVFQESVLELFITLEAAGERAARESEHPKPVILCDRGIMDALAYTPRNIFIEMMRSGGLDMERVREQRYHAVFHLRSASVGAEQFYSPTGNPARLESSIEEARAADERTLAAWVGHPRLTVIENDSFGFEGKLERLFQGVQESLCET